jgi:ABC-type nickel/cobalt efflux system permease component RcnA
MANSRLPNESENAPVKRYLPWSIGLLALISLLTSGLLPAKEAAAHPIDEYVQNTYIDPAPDRTALELNLTPGVLVAPQVIALIDADGDGEISEAEGEAYANDYVLRDIALEVDGEPQPLTLVDDSFPTPLDMSAGMGTIRLHVVTEAPKGVPGDHSLSFRNDHQPVKSKYLVNAFKKSNEVEISQQDRDKFQHAIRVDYSVTPESSATSDTVAASKDDDGADVGTTGGLSDRAQWLAGYLYEPASSPWLLVVGLGLSALLGGLHALTPGHGKTLVAAYLIGSRGTVRHAAALGSIVTLTHTASVIAVGLLALLAGQYILPDVLVPALEVGAGLLVIALGLRLVRARWRTRGGHHDHGHHHHDHGHHHDDHHHLPKGDVRPGDLLAMGVSGGLVPCPEALGVMLIAIGLGRIGLGLALIVAFSLGLALVLIALGILLVRCKSRLDRLGKPGSPWQRLLPLFSAAVVTLLGVGIVLKGLMSYVS